MKLSKTWKIIIGILTAIFTLLPILFFLLGMGIMISTFSMSGNPRAEPTAGFMIMFFLIMIAQFAWIFLRLGLISFYQVHAILNDKGSKIYRILLSVGNFIFPFISLPIYYFIFIFPDETPNWALEEPVLAVEEIVEVKPKKAKPKAKKKATKKKTGKSAE
ncbi:MAG: hypothetical protein HON98_01450 [Chloroflexi bacterium]|jgi:hypothetical protein|nr:hypothetical protein [Chloroflexota bacterium]MBT3668800.1 hypothetical protein [Chloroflexota bacterium]MBT4003819.1 hypothetical protein [Chloroflexota bacterium]MBT4306514.1 hypothetical protein [Chloroflexota bacterium]MBT4533898.1 hypothetical protein [Chloroflexota bacterium]